MSTQPKVNTDGENAAVLRVVEERAGLKPDDPKACWIWPGTVQQGGPSVRFGQNGPSYHIRRSLWHVHHGVPVPDGMYLVAKCGVARCVRVEHLELRDRGEISRRRGEVLKAKAAEARASVEARAAELLGKIPKGRCQVCGAPCGRRTECRVAAGCAARASERLVRIRGEWEWRDTGAMARPYAVGFTS